MKKKKPHKRDRVNYDGTTDMTAPFNIARHARRIGLDLQKQPPKVRLLRTGKAR